MYRDGTWFILRSSDVGVTIKEWGGLLEDIPVPGDYDGDGIAVLVGAAVLFDLRLLGVSRILPVTALAAHLLPWARASLLFIVPSGLMMFTAHATEFATNPAFQLKLALLAAASANAIAFHLRTFRTVASWDRGAPAPPAAKVAAILSLLLWSGVIICGRLLAYL